MGGDSSEEIFEVSEDGFENKLEDETMVDHHEFLINVEHIGQMEESKREILKSFWRVFWRWEKFICLGPTF